MKLLALAGYPTLGAATRFRVEALRPYLKAEGIDLTLRPFLSEHEFRRFYSCTPSQRVQDLAHATRRLLWDLRRASEFDGVFVQREAALVGPALAEAVFARSRPMLLDYDDSIWLDAHSGVKGLIRHGRKQHWLFRNANALVAGSEYLAREGLQLATAGTPVHVARTVVSAERWRPREQAPSGDPKPPVLGWIGTPSTAPALLDIEGALIKLRQEHRFHVRIVGGGAFRFRELDAQYDDWDLAREAEDFASMHIGLGPMLDTPWWLGKCAFKQVQFMTVGVPTVSTPIGAVREVVCDEETGLFASSEDKWCHQLSRLLSDGALHARIREACRAAARDTHSIEVQGPLLASFVRKTLERGC